MRSNKVAVQLKREKKFHSCIHRYTRMNIQEKHWTQPLTQGYTHKYTTRIQDLGQRRALARSLPPADGRDVADAFMRRRRERRRRRGSGGEAGYGPSLIGLIFLKTYAYTHTHLLTNTSSRKPTTKSPGCCEVAALGSLFGPSSETSDRTDPVVWLMLPAAISLLLSALMRECACICVWAYADMCMYKMHKHIKAARAVSKKQHRRQERATCRF